MEISPLTAVRLVLRQRLPVNAPDVVGVIITDFLLRDLTMRDACDLSHAESTDLLDFVWARGLRAVESERWSVGKMLHMEPRYARWAFTRAMVGAVRRGDLAMVQWLRGRIPDCPFYEDVLDEACKCGRLGALQLLHCVGNGNDFRWSSLVTKLAAEFGHWDVVHWLHERHPRLPVSCALAFALKQNNLEEIMWIAAHSAGIAAVGDTYTPYSEETWSARKDCVRYLVARGLAVQGVVEAALPAAGEAGDLKFFQWLMRRPESSHFTTSRWPCSAALFIAPLTAASVQHSGYVVWSHLTISNRPARAAASIGYDDDGFTVVFVRSHCSTVRFRLRDAQSIASEVQPSVRFVLSHSSIVIWASTNESGLLSTKQ
jgi:hypothetical protein